MQWYVFRVYSFESGRSVKTYGGIQLNRTGGSFRKDSSVVIMRFSSILKYLQLTRISVSWENVIFTSFIL